MGSKREFITVEQAIEMLPDSEMIHTFRNSPSMLIGADWPRDAVIEELRKAGAHEIERGGENCRRMKHALVLWTSLGPLFIETKEEQ